MLLEKLDQEIGWQWRWEKLNRCLCLGASWCARTCSFLVFVLAFCQVYFGENPKYWITVAIAVCSVATFSLPILSHELKWKQRQLFHDKRAREYDIVHMKLKTNEIDVPQAMRLFERAHRQSPEAKMKDVD